MKIPIKIALCLFTACLVWAFAQQTPAQGNAGFVVIVNAANGTASMERDRVGKFFLKRLKSWDDGVAVVPVDQLPSSRVREDFTQGVFGKKISTIKSYWQRMIFSGKAVPPPELDSDAAVIAFVRGDPGAIGYVAPRTELDDGVKELKLVE